MNIYHFIDYIAQIVYFSDINKFKKNSYLNFFYLKHIWSNLNDLNFLSFIKLNNMKQLITLFKETDFIL